MSVSLLIVSSGVGVLMVRFGLLARLDSGSSSVVPGTTMTAYDVILKSISKCQKVIHKVIVIVHG